MIRNISAIALSAVLASVAVSASAGSSLENSVANELAFYGFDHVNAAELSNAQLGGIYSELSSDESYGSIQSAISVILSK
ncbi:MAG: hypothetical protein ACPGNV_12315 [Mangrovicoccus sp.]